MPCEILNLGRLDTFFKPLPRPVARFAGVALAENSSGSASRTSRGPAARQEPCRSGERIVCRRVYSEESSGYAFRGPHSPKLSRIAPNHGANLDASLPVVENSTREARA
jgi:hypothetical protein